MGNGDGGNPNKIYEMLETKTPCLPSKGSEFYYYFILPEFGSGKQTLALETWRSNVFAYDPAFRFRLFGISCTFHKNQNISKI